MFIECEAVVRAFNFSDLRQNSNVSQHRIEVFYQACKNIQLGFTDLFGRPLNWHTVPEPMLKRLRSLTSSTSSSCSAAVILLKQWGRLRQRHQASEYQERCEQPGRCTHHGKRPGCEVPHQSLSLLVLCRPASRRCRQAR